MVVSVKNYLSNVNGFSPNQLGLGFNPNTPSILNDHTPALEYGTSFYIVYKNTQGLNKSREEFIKNECR